MVALRKLVVECVFTRLRLLEDHFKCSIYSITPSLPVFKFQFTVKPWLTIQNTIQSPAWRLCENRPTYYILIQSGPLSYLTLGNLTSFQIWTKMNRESGQTSETSQEMHCMGGKWSLRFLNDWNYGGILTLQEVVIKKRGLRVKSSSCCVSDSFFFAKYKRRSSFVGQRHTWRVMSYQYLCRVWCLIRSSHVALNMSCLI